MGPTEGEGQAGVLSGVPQRANALGPAAAPVTLDYFGDLECPFCKDFTLQVLPSIIERWVAGGNLRIEYHALQTATREPDVFLSQQVAALAAGRQDREWNFIETFYREQGQEGSGYVTEEFLRGVASQIQGLDLSRWSTDRADQELAGEIARDAELAAEAGLNGTPSFLIGRSGGRMTAFAPSDLASFDSAVEQALAS
ncbi:MAG TPA: thioredoxin domain-containing protein [Solirubrobacteraceae bacterium]|nr:thioredoxin domain-containing protein [Solirubrobacteraceae bacterium]